MVNNFLFGDGREYLASADCFIAHIPKGISGSGVLFDTLSEKLRFPAYFGHNWNALDECLGDLGWIENDDVVLIHEDLPNLGDRATKIYLDVLSEAVLSMPKDYHRLIVIFPKEVSQKISQVMAGS